MEKLYSAVDYFYKTLHEMFHWVMNMPLIRLNKILMRCHLFHKKLGLQYLQISSTFEFIIVFTLHCSETLLIANSVHVSLISNWFTHAVEYIWYWSANIYLLKLIKIITVQLLVISLVKVNKFKVNDTVLF